MRLSKIEREKYIEYHAAMVKHGIEPRSSDAWTKHYRESQANLKRLAESAGKTNKKEGVE